VPARKCDPTRMSEPQAPPHRHASAQRGSGEAEGKIWQSTGERTQQIPSETNILRS